MKLLIDAGNTRIKWALVAGEQWLRSGNLLTEQVGDLSSDFAQLASVQQVWVSNVAGEPVAQQIHTACSERDWPTHFIAAQLMQCGVRNGYTQPQQLGSDRWAALIAAWHQIGRACLVVNCGTTTTIDALSAQGEFIGGIILPGVDLMQRSLSLATARLQTADGVYVPLPLNTADAVYSGAIQAGCGAIQRQHALLKDDDAPVLLSGGAAAQLQGCVAQRVTHRVDDLVLQGLLLIAKDAG